MIVRAVLIWMLTYGGFNVYAQVAEKTSRPVNEKLNRRVDQAIVGKSTKQKGESQVNFDQQNQQLQSQMQQENRTYSAISKTMKAKHDTAKNSEGNVR